MPDPRALPDDTAAVIRLVADAAERYLAAVESEPAMPAEADVALAGIDAPLPEDGTGAPDALGRLVDAGLGAATRSAGPRFFHFVTGGSTPAALGADWLTSTFDQNAFAWVSSPLASRLETVAVRWLKDLFELPPAWGGVLTTGTTMSNLVGLAAARRWRGQRLGVDVEEDGLAGVPPARVLASDYLHSSDVKALAILGMGRSSVRRLVADDIGRIDLRAVEAELRREPDDPAIIVAVAGEVNAGDSDPIADLADLAETYGAWLHVDGAFGLFGRLTPLADEAVAGLERAHSVAVDGHKWLNVPYDTGAAFVRDPALLAGAFGATAAYFPSPDDPRPSFGFLGPEMSRRGRALAVWATLQAYGRQGYRAMVERHVTLARRMAAAIDAAPELERLAEVPLNVVCFRARPVGGASDDLDALNTRLGAAIVEDGRFLAGTTRYRGVVALRPAIANWRTTDADVDAFVDVVRELAARVAASPATTT